jgi:hypothetical protein
MKLYSLDAFRTTEMFLDLRYCAMADSGAELSEKFASGVNLIIIKES